MNKYSLETKFSDCLGKPVEGFRLILGIFLGKCHLHHLQYFTNYHTCISAPVSGQADNQGEFMIQIHKNVVLFKVQNCLCNKNTSFFTFIFLNICNADFKQSLKHWDLHKVAKKFYRKILYQILERFLKVYGLWGCRINKLHGCYRTELHLEPALGANPKTKVPLPYHYPPLLLQNLMRLPLLYNL